MINIVFVEPEIPYNTGALIRTCGLTNSKLHVVRPLGFSLEDSKLKRAGLDYWELSSLEVHENFWDLYESNKSKNFYFATTKAKKIYTEINYKDGDFIVFGKETAGLSREILSIKPENNIKIPILKTSKRSLNLANSANIILYEVLRQLDFKDLK